MRTARLLTAAVMAAVFASAILAPLLSDAADAGNAECNGAVITTLEDSIRINAGGDGEFCFYISNASDAPIFVEADAGGLPDALSVDFRGQDHVKIDPHDAASVIVSVSADMFAHQSAYALTFTFKVVKEGAVGGVDVPYTVDVESVYSSGSQFNKILGVFPALPAPLDSPFVTGLVTFGLWFLLAAAFAYALIRIVVRLLVRAGKDERDEVVKSTQSLLFFVAVLYGLSNTFRVMGVGEYYVGMLMSISQVLYIVAGAVIVWRVYGSLMKGILSDVGRKNRAGIDETLLPLFKMLGKIVIAAFAFASVLAILGFNLMAILTGAGILGLALSLGAQSTLNEFFSGIRLLVTRPFKAGDMVRLGGGDDTLEVRRVGLMDTSFKNWSNAEVFSMPNSTVVSSVIVNITGENRAYCVYLYFGVGYSSDTELVKKLLLEAAWEHTQVITDGSFSKPSVRLTSFDDSCITFRLSFYVNDFDDNGLIAGEIRESVFKKFNENGIDIPFNQLDVNVRGLGRGA